MRGYIQIYTGNGNGKTTAALGLTLRAVGAGKSVFFAQFAKGQIYSEIKMLQQNIPNVEVRQSGLECFIYREPSQADIDAARKGLEEVSEIIITGRYAPQELIDLADLVTEMKTTTSVNIVIRSGSSVIAEPVTDITLAGLALRLILFWTTILLLIKQPTL